MCGLFGVLGDGSGREPCRDRLEQTARLMHHRGPDGHRVHAGPDIGLVHTRLSLVDLNERSAQPFFDASGRYALVYNGELYDYEPLRAELEAAGAVFRTTSDTEVLLEALLRLGVEQALARIDGMYAFALYDSEERSLVLARDRFGIKPLFVHEGEGRFLFGSSVEALRPWMDIAPDPVTVGAYLQGFNGPMSGRSFYAGVEILPPGTVLRVRAGGRSRRSQCLGLREFVDPAMAEEFARQPLGELVDRLDALLRRSVESQLCADVPVGAFCSGGVDSSLLMAMAARSHGDLRVFHADIAGPLSERAAAERLSRHLGLELQAVRVEDRHFVELLPDVVTHFGAPFINPTTVPVLMVSRLVNAHGIKAVLTGEASDECFLGYEWLSPDPRAALRRLPLKILGKLGLARPRKPDPAARDLALATALGSRFEVGLGPAEPDDEQDSVYHARGGEGLAFDPNLSYILRTLLHRNDTMGMAASVESRFPFLDARVVRASVNLPYRSKIRYSPKALDPRHLFVENKWIVREVAARYLPRELSHRPKGMFPTNAFQRMQVDDALFADSFVADWYGLGARRLRHLLAGASPSLRLRLLVLEVWGQCSILGAPRDRVDAALQRHVRVRPL